MSCRGFVSLGVCFRCEVIYLTVKPLKGAIREEICISKFERKKNPQNSRLLAFNVQFSVLAGLWRFQPLFFRIGANAQHQQSVHWPHSCEMWKLFLAAIPEILSSAVVLLQVLVDCGWMWSCLVLQLTWLIFFDKYMKIDTLSIYLLHSWYVLLMQNILSRLSITDLCWIKATVVKCRQKYNCDLVWWK